MTALPALPIDPDGLLVVAVDVPAGLLTVSGELDSCSAPRLLEAVPALAAGGTAVWRVDAEGVTFCDGAGLAVLLEVRRQATLHGATLRLVGAGRCLRRLVSLVGLADVLAVEPVPVPLPRPVPDRLRHPADRRTGPPLSV